MSKNIKFIAASDYTFQKVTGNSEKDFKVFYDKDNQRVLYHGSLKFTATKVAKSYLVVNGSELVKADYKEIDDLFKGEKNKSKINVIASGNEVVIDANTLRIDGDLSEVLAVNTTETVKIIFMNSDEENTLNSYQVISFNIINKTSN